LLHLLEVNGGKHKTKEKVEGLLDDDILGLEPRSLVGVVQYEAINDGKHTPTEGDSWSADWNEPVGQKEENPESKVHKPNRNGTEGTGGGGSVVWC
jgi:hypothetical protein